MIAGMAEEPLDLGSLADDPSDVYPACSRRGAISCTHGHSGTRTLCDRMGSRFAGKEGVSGEGTFLSCYWSLDIFQPDAFY